MRWGWRRLAADADVWDSPECETLATQCRKGRRARRATAEPTHRPDAIIVEEASVLVVLDLDGYAGWLAAGDWHAAMPCEPPSDDETDPHPASIDEARRRAVAFCLDAERTPNQYLWGGTLGPDYDCSGLVQAAYASAGLWLPRDAYQQRGHTEDVSVSEAQPGDLVFFGGRDPEKVTHVGLVCTAGPSRLAYVHSSGRQMGRDRIGRDELGGETGSEVGQRYQEIFLGCGRVTRGLRASESPPPQRGFPP
ncbi:cell wall-associated hydrolase NlpC/P60 [Chloropicon roscoffensis]|uniref:Cell wall-associated hydrolase NlpC/P60 n=1 Tax=Chloropicon roscoffensis TaxID=1461544 RepID=A0AAX4NYZ8_9CHLO